MKLYKSKNNNSLRITIYSLLPPYLTHKNFSSNINTFLKQLFKIIQNGIKDDEQLIQSKSFWCLLALINGCPAILTTLMNDILKLFTRLISDKKIPLRQIAFQQLSILSKFSQNYTLITIDSLVNIILKGIDDNINQDVAAIITKSFGRIMAEYSNNNNNNNVIVRYGEDEINKWFETKKITIPTDRSVKIVTMYFIGLIIKGSTTIEHRKLYSESLINYLLRMTCKSEEWKEIIYKIIKILSNTVIHKSTKEETIKYAVNIITNGIITKISVTKLISLYNSLCDDLLHEIKKYNEEELYTLLSILHQCIIRLNGCNIDFKISIKLYLQVMNDLTSIPISIIIGHCLYEICQINNDLFNEIFTHFFSLLSNILTEFMLPEDNVNSESVNKFKSAVISFLIFSSICQANIEINKDQAMFGQILQANTAIINLYNTMKSNDKNVRPILHYCYYLLSGTYVDPHLDIDKLDEIIIILNKNLLNYNELLKNKKIKNEVLLELISLLDSFNSLLRYHNDIMKSALAPTLLSIYKQYIEIYNTISTQKNTDITLLQYLNIQMLTFFDNIPENNKSDLFPKIFPLIKLCFTSGGELPINYIYKYIQCNMNLLSYEYPKYYEKIWNLRSNLDNNHNRVNNINDEIGSLLYNREILHKDFHSNNIYSSLELIPVQEITEMMTIKGVYTMGLGLFTLLIDQCNEYISEIIELAKNPKNNINDKKKYDVDVNLIIYICI